MSSGMAMLACFSLTSLLRAAIIVAAISPADVNYGETLSTLHYGKVTASLLPKSMFR